MTERRTLGDMGYVESFQGTGGASGDAGGDSNGSGDGGGRRYYGKYRGIVLQNIDPERRGRLMVQVPDVLGPSISSWALPCVPWAGLQMGAYVVPPPQAGVWIEFEKGDPDYPIWTGFFWSTQAEPPASANASVPGSPMILIQSITKSTFVLSDTPIPPMLAPGIMLQSGATTITLDAKGVKIVAPLVEITGVLKVNETALVVT
jgi:hypothetical protein